MSAMIRGRSGSVHSSAGTANTSTLREGENDISRSLFDVQNTLLSPVGSDGQSGSAKPESHVSAFIRALDSAGKGAFGKTDPGVVAFVINTLQQKSLR